MKKNLGVHVACLDSLGEGPAVVAVDAVVAGPAGQGAPAPTAYLQRPLSVAL